MMTPAPNIDDLLHAQQTTLADLEKLSSNRQVKRIKLLLLVGPPGSGKTTVLRAFCDRNPGAQLVLAVDLIPDRPPSEDPDYVRNWCRKLAEVSRKGIVVVDGMDILSCIVNLDWMLDLVKQAQETPMTNFVVLALSVGESRLLPTVGQIQSAVDRDRIAELSFEVQDALNLAHRFGATVTAGDLYHARFQPDA